MMEVVKQIKLLWLGVFKGKVVLYELLWYVIIGNLVVGKSIVIFNFGLQFLFEDNCSNVIQGIGGICNCDWYFIIIGIVLDIVGCYLVSVEDCMEWLIFFGLLKKNCLCVLINGVIIVVSIVELFGSKFEFVIELVKNLCQCVQEIIEWLEVFVLVYVLFIKVDLIVGFSEFFCNLDLFECESVWGVMLLFDVQVQSDVLIVFDVYFDELVEGIKEMSLLYMVMQCGCEVLLGLLMLLLEFVGIKLVLCIFIVMLFEDNLFQFKLVFCGFYFSSVLQEGYLVYYVFECVGCQFLLFLCGVDIDVVFIGQIVFFFKDLFCKVIFLDKELVCQYFSLYQNCLCYGVFFGVVGVLVFVLGLWIWLYIINVQLVNNVIKDLEQVVCVQKDCVDLKLCIDVLLLLQDCMEQFDCYKKQGGIIISLGLYQGDNICVKLMKEYYYGMQQVMLDLIVSSLEGYFGQVVVECDKLGQGMQVVVESEVLYQNVLLISINDVYNVFKIYLMLGNCKQVESVYLFQQLILFWCNWLDVNCGQMSCEDMVWVVEKLMNFYVVQLVDLGWFQIQNKVMLVSDSCQVLIKVMKGQLVMQCVFVQIKVCVGVCFLMVMVDLLVGEECNGCLIIGSYVIFGVFLCKVWEDYVKDVINEVVNIQFSIIDWVFDIIEQSDLLLVGSLEYILCELVILYKQEYVKEWIKFMQGLSIVQFDIFEQVIVCINMLGDVINLLLCLLLEKINEQIIWDNLVVEVCLKKVKGGFVVWFQKIILCKDLEVVVQ